jgi:glycogen debranching enzyme
MTQYSIDGTLAEPPIALYEVQAYVFAAMRAVRTLRESDNRTSLTSCQVKPRIQKKFEHQFWDEDLNTYVLALDGQKKPCRVRTSNAGHCLYCGIVSPERARKLANTLLGEGLFCGWGIRTLDTREIRYNPMSYHNGSIWPHDNALVARDWRVTASRGRRSRSSAACLRPVHLWTSIACRNCSAVFIAGRQPKVPRCIPSLAHLRPGPPGP